MDYMNRVEKAARAIEDVCGRADVGIILGSGLGDYASAMTDGKSLAYEEIPSFPASTVEGHAGRWHVGLLEGKRVYMMQGRFHAYEGYSLEEVTLPIRAMQLLGVKTLIVTNAAGGVNASFSPGDLMLISDFINLTGKNPLTGTNLSVFGPRFPDMSYAYDPDLRALAQHVAEKADIKLQNGVYCCMNGPCYETPAEIRMIRTLGGDAVGMSTVPETIVARHGGMRVLGISCITNMAAGMLDKPLDHNEVMETGLRARETFTHLLNGVLAAL